MGSSGPASDVTPHDVRGAVEQFESPSTPVTTTEVAERLECPPQAAQDRLEDLVDRGELQTRRIGDAERVWWRPAGRPSIGLPSEREVFGEFISAVKDYAIFALDPDGFVATWNEGAARIKGYDAGTIVGEHFSTFYTDEAVEAGVPERNLEIAAEEGRVEDEGWRVRADGTRFWANVTITAIRDDDGELRGFTKVTRDMTERREYEQELRRERDFTEQILETVPTAICMITPDGEFVRVNQQMLDRFGTGGDENEVYDVDSWEIYDEEGDPIPVERWPWRRVVDTGDTVRDFECQVELPHLDRRWLSINAAPIEDGDHDERLAVLSIDDITEQKDRERRLRREYEQTEKLLRTAPVAIAVQNADGETVMANERAQEALGLSEQEIVGESDDLDEWNIYGADGSPLAPEETPSARVLETGEPVIDEELVIDPPDGDRMQFRLNATPMFGPDGDLERIVVAGEDITELKRHERQLERRKAELETELGEILDRISDAFYALDDEWRFTHLNDRAADILGRPREELLGRVIWDEFPETTESTYWDRLHAAMESQEPTSFEVHEQGIDAWLEFNVYPSETGLSIYFRDVTERKYRERELRRTERRFQAIFEDPNILVGLLDPDGTVLDINETAMEYVDASLEEVTGEPLWETPWWGEGDGVGERVREWTRRAAAGEYVDFEADLTRPDGTRYTLSGVFRPVTDDEGDVVSIVVSDRDITERREYERKLEESNERLEQFAYAVSHDLQEPLRMVSSYLQLIEQRYGDDLEADGREFLEFAVDGADRMRSMIEGLLEYSRVETQGDPFEPVDLGTVLADVHADLQFRIEESNADISAGSLPQVEGDPSQLRQLFQNLLDNAIEYSGDEPPQIEVDAERDGPEWIVSVSDEGIGIDPDDQDRIFEVFQRLHARDEHDGTGIGLAICERIVERHGGEIWADSEPGEGTTFSFTLPAADGTEARS